MLLIWNPVAEGSTQKLCGTHFSLSGEKLDPSKLKAYSSTICPYDGYTLIRLEISPQIISRGGERQTVGCRSVSYVLLATDSSVVEFPLIPLTERGPFIYAINNLLRYSVTRPTAQRYVIFFGHLASRSPFYFFNRLEQIEDLLRSVTAEDKKRAQSTVMGIFGNREGNELNIEVNEHSHFPFADYFTLRMPCIYEGDLYVTRLRLSKTGEIVMDNDDKLNLEGFFDEESNLRYYPLAPSPALRAIQDGVSRKAVRIRNLISNVLLADTALQWLILPWFLFQLFLLVRFHLTDNMILAYFQRLQDSRLLTFVCSLLGISGTCMAVFRYGFIEFAIYLKGLAPSYWSQVASQVEETSRRATNKMGVVLYTVANVFEFGLRTLMALSLLFYGLLNLPGLPSLPHLNFGQSILIVLFNIPLLGWALEFVIGKAIYNSVQFPGFVNTLAKVVVGFMFSTVILGLIGRLYSLGNKKE